MPNFEVVEDAEGIELIVRKDDDLFMHSEVVNLVMEVMRLNPGWAKHWLELAQYMVFEGEEWGEA